MKNACHGPQVRTIAIFIVAFLSFVVTNSDPARAADNETVILGMADPAWGIATYSNAEALAHPTQVRGAGLNWISVGPELLMSGPNSSVIYQDNRRTASDSSLASIVEAAHKAGLNVFFRPFIDSATSGRTQIDPADRGVWFGWLRYWMNHYAALAERLGVEMFSVGANYEKLSSDYRYLRVIDQVRERFGGKVTYDASLYEYRSVLFWDKLDYVGIDAYWSFRPEDPRSVSEIRSLWTPITDSLESFSQLKRKEILFTEAGYRSITGAIYMPGDWQTPGAIDEDSQAAAYEALLLANLNRSYFAGVFFWQWDTVGKLDQRADYTPHNKKAERVLMSLSPYD